MRRWRTGIVATVAIAMVVGSVAPGHARHDDDAEGGKKVLGVRPWAYKFLEEAYATLDKDDYPATIDTLDRMRRKDRRLNVHERALMWQTYAYVEAAQEHYDAAIAAFEKALADDAMPDASMQNVRYNLAQLYLVLERYDDAIRGFQVWLKHAADPTPSGYFMLAMAYLQSGDGEKALVYARQAVAVAAEHPREPWLQLLASLLIQNGAYTEAAPVMEQLVALFPKKSYFTQLSALYGELGAHDRSLATLELAYVQGLLDDGAELRTLAQLYLYNQVPVKAAHVLEDAMRSGSLPDDAASWRLLGDAWLQAKEREKAIEPLGKAARLAENGEGWLRLARVQLDAGDWDAARDSLRAGIQRGGLSDPGTAYVLIGITHVSQDQLVAARRAFEEAKAYSTTEQVAVQWLATVDSQLRVLEAEEATTADSTRGGATNARNG